MAGRGRTVFIAGAGVAGLTLALALAKFGITVIVLERNGGISEFGAGLQISPNARRVLDALGLGEALAARSLEPAGIDVYPFRYKSPLVTLELGEAARERFASPYAVMHRADLVDVLHRACKRFANIEIVFGVRSFDAQSHAKGVSVVSDGVEGQGRSGRGFAFIGADGVHSPTRTRLLGGEPARYAGRLAWRTLIAFDKVSDLIAGDRTSILLAPGYHLVAYPLPHRRMVNLALFAKAKTVTGEEEWRGGRPTAPRFILPSARIDALLERAADRWTAWPLYRVEAKSWHEGAIGLVGDAAHAMLPFQAQGAAMAVEDAAILAPLLAATPDAETAFSRFERLRRARVSRVARVSATNGTLFHLEWPFTIGRNLVMLAQGRRGHFRRLGWLYDYRAGAELDGALHD